MLKDTSGNTYDVIAPWEFNPQPERHNENSCLVTEKDHIVLKKMLNDSKVESQEFNWTVVYSYNHYIPLFWWSWKSQAGCQFMHTSNMFTWHLKKYYWISLLLKLDFKSRYKVVTSTEFQVRLTHPDNESCSTNACIWISLTGEGRDAHSMQ